MQSRLDYFIVAEGIMYDIVKCDIYPGFISDHSIIALQLKLPAASQHGKGTWKFNASLLSDKEYVEKINILLDECINKYRNIRDHGLKWDVIKSEIRG